MTLLLPLPGLARPGCLAALITLVLTPWALVQEAKPRPLAVVLPLERTNYIVGETILLAVANDAQPYHLQWTDPAGRVAVSYQGSEPILRIATGPLAPGRYTIQVNGRPSPVSVGLTSPLRVSPAAFPGELWPGRPTSEAYAGLSKRLREGGINALMAAAYEEVGGGRFAAHDDLAGTGTVIFFHPAAWRMRSYPARVYEPELRSFRQRLALCAQANARYPTFGGFQYDWEPVSLGDRSALLFAGGWGKETAALHAYLQRSYRAVLHDFTTRTKLKPVSDAESWHYSLAVGHPEWVPLLDRLPPQWAQAFAKTCMPLAEADRKQLEKRLDAWSAYWMGLDAETYEGHNAVLHDVLPGLQNTSSVDADRAAVGPGPYLPAAYAPLAFRYLTARSDPKAGPKVPYHGLWHAALLEIDRRPEQPIWVASGLGTAPDAATRPGQFMRLAGQNLAYGGLGVGRWDLDCRGRKLADTTPDEDGRSGQEFLRRFAALGAACAPVRHIGLLYSRTQLSRQPNRPAPDAPLFNVFLTLARLGYTPRFLTEEAILAGNLDEVKALVVVNQGVALPDPVLAKLKAFVAGGGRILTDHQTTVSLPRAERIDVHLPCTNRELASALLAALGNDGRSGLRSQRGADSQVSTFQLHGGPDATYVVAVNDAADGFRHREELVPNKEVPWTVYDLTKERALGRLAPVTCTFEDLTVRLYGILRRPVRAIDLEAVQRLTGGEDVQVRVRFVGTDGRFVRAAIPFCLTWKRPDGTTAHELYRCTDRTGTCVLAWTCPVNEPAETWTLSVRSQLDGRTASLPVVVTAGDALEAEPVADRVIVRGGAAIRDLLAKKPEFVIPVFPTKQQDRLVPVAQAVQKKLEKCGVAAEVRPNPTMSVYHMGYDPTKVESLQNLLAEKGETIGRVKVTTVQRNDYFAPLSGYVFGKPLLLLDLAGTGANEMAARLEAEGLLWPKASAAFPGPGRAVIQLVKSAFWLGQDTLVIQATDVAGLRAGVSALADLPEDAITPGIAGARKRLLSELGIGERPQPVPDEDELTGEGAKAGSAPQPLTIRWGKRKP